MFMGNILKTAIIVSLISITSISCRPSTVNYKISKSAIPNLNIDSKLIRCGTKAGTVTILNGDTYLTNAHVVTGCRPTIDGKYIPVKYTSLEKDIALLGEGTNVSNVSCNYLYGKFASFYGYPAGAPQGIMGLIEDSGKVQRDVPFGFAEGFVYQGMSGSPIVLDRKLYGIIFASSADNKGMYYITGPQICEFLYDNGIISK